MDLDDEELDATRDLHGLDKQKKAEKIILKQKQEIERLNNLVDTMKRNVKENYTSNLTIEREIDELKNMKVEGEVFTTAVNFAIKILQKLLENKEV